MHNPKIKNNKRVQFKIMKFMWIFGTTRNSNNKNILGKYNFLFIHE